MITNVMFKSLGHAVDVCTMCMVKVYHISNGLTLNNGALSYLMNTTSYEHNI